MNTAAYSWPKGWSSREEIAEQLECSAERVREVLGPGIKAGTIEFKDFKTWEDGRFVRRTGYRKVGVVEQKKAEPMTVTPKAGMAVVSRKRGTRGKIVEVKGQKMVIDWETTGRKECGVSALRKKDIRLA